MIRGFLGTFLFLDYLPSLNVEAHGLPAWLLWFSIMAAHSDLVLFVAQGDQDLLGSQKLETEFTPDRIPKKIVRLESDELTWAKSHGDVPEQCMYFVPGKGLVTRAQWDADEAAFALPFVEQYQMDDLPADRIFRMLESGEVEEYPLDRCRSA
jgi:hypothetical protein